MPEQNPFAGVSKRAKQVATSNIIWTKIFVLNLNVLDHICLGSATILWDLPISAYCFFQGSAFEPRIATKRSMEYICERKRKGVTWVVCKLFHIDCPEFWSRNSHFAWNQLLTNIRHIFDQNLNISSPGIFPGHLSVCRCSSPTQPSNQIWRWWYLLKELNKNQTVYKHRRPMKFEMRAIHFKEENVDLLPYNYIWQFHYLRGPVKNVLADFVR